MFKNPTTIDDYYIYYVKESSAEEVIIDHGFTQEKNFCNTVCALYEADNEPAHHPSI